MYGIYFEQGERTGRRPGQPPRRQWLCRRPLHHGEPIGIWSYNPALARRFDTRAEAEAAVAAEFDSRWADEPTLVGRLPSNGEG